MSCFVNTFHLLFFNLSFPHVDQYFRFRFTSTFTRRWTIRLIFTTLDLLTESFLDWWLSLTKGNERRTQEMLGVALHWISNYKTWQSWQGLWGRWARKWVRETSFSLRSWPTTFFRSVLVMIIFDDYIYDKSLNLRRRAPTTAWTSPHWTSNVVEITASLLIIFGGNSVALKGLHKHDDEDSDDDDNDHILVSFGGNSVDHKGLVWLWWWLKTTFEFD